MAHVEWTLPARQDVRDIRAYIARDSARYARLVAARLVRAVDALEHHPLAGLAVPELARPDFRELIEGAYRIVYRAAGDEVQILAVVHGARQFPAGVGHRLALASEPSKSSARA